MQITIDTNNLSEMDINMLAFLAESGEAVAEEPEPEPEPEPVKPKKETAAAKKKRLAQEAEAAAAEEEPAAEEEEDLLGGGPTVDDAVAAATLLVADGKAPQVKAALAEVEVKRVSDLEQEQVPAFLAALEAGE